MCFTGGDKESCGAPGVSGALKINWEYYIVFYNSGILVAGLCYLWILLERRENSKNLVLSKVVTREDILISMENVQFRHSMPVTSYGMKIYF